MGDPIGAAKHVHQSLANEGTWMIVEPFANDQFKDNLNPVGRVYYSFSTLLCTPCSRSQEVGLCLGAQAGEARIRDVITSAGFSNFRRATETPFNIVYEPASRALVCKARQKRAVEAPNPSRVMPLSMRWPAAFETAAFPALCRRLRFRTLAKPAFSSMDSSSASREAEPFVGVQFARLFKAVLDEIEDDDAAAGGENARRLCEGALGVQRVVQRLREEDQIDFAVGDGNLFHVAEAVVDVLHSVAESLFAGDLDHFGRAVDGDYFLGALGEQESGAALTRAEVGNDHGRDKTQQGFGQALPRFAGNVVFAHAAGDRVKEGAHFVLAFFEHAAHGGLVLRGFGDLAVARARRPSRKLPSGAKAPWFGLPYRQTKDEALALIE